MGQKRTEESKKLMSERKKESWARREENGYGVRENGSRREEVRQKISEVIARHWESGRYDSRVNGMTGVTASSHPNWTWGKHLFREILEQFEEPRCRVCGRETDLNVHHIDGNHDNYLLSNLLWVCVPCHLWKFHYNKGRRAPFVRLSKEFSFEYAHVLPWHPGKCARLHGHSGHITVSVEGRLNPNGVVMDYADLSKIVKATIIEPFDHTLLNEVMENPTSENFLVLAWQRLEGAGLKGLSQISFKETDSSEAVLTKASMIEAWGWDRDGSGKFFLTEKPLQEER